MGKFDRRLQRLEVVYPKRENATEGDTSHLCFWSRPLYFEELHQFIRSRAEERYVATVRGGRYGSNTVTDPGWPELSYADKSLRIKFEWDELSRLIDELGESDGWAAWHDQARDWPQKYSRFDAASLERRLLHAWTVADSHRAHPQRPLWRQVWPEWQPGMTYGEHLQFDMLLYRDRFKRCKPYGTPYGG